MKIKKFEKNYSQLAWKKNVIQIRNLKQALNQRWALKKVNWVLTFKQEVWLKPYLDMNTELIANATNHFK